MAKYYVTQYNSIKPCDGESVLLKTDSLAEALWEARWQTEMFSRTGEAKKGYAVEIRVYAEDIENDECECFDYETVEF